MAGVRTLLLFLAVLSLVWTTSAEAAPPSSAPMEIAQEEPKTGDEAEPVSPATAPLRITIPAPEVIPGRSNPPLEGEALDLGPKIHLGRPYRAAEQAPEGCIEKAVPEARFCVDAVTWPDVLREALVSTPAIYGGHSAIIRYDDDRSSQAHVLFPSANFLDVVEHLTDRFGPPTEQNMIKTPVPGDEPVTNMVVKWLSRMPDERRTLVLEVRANDDVRHPFPDEKHGFIWLHHVGADPVFRHLSVVDLMVLRKRHLSLWPFEDKKPDSEKP